MSETNIFIYKKGVQISDYRDIQESQLTDSGYLLVTAKSGVVSGWAPGSFDYFEVGEGLE